MGFKDKLKNSIESVSDKLQVMGTSLTKVIKTSKDSVSSNEKLSKEKTEEISALKVLMEESSGNTKEIADSLSSLFANIEVKRLEMVQELSVQYIKPMEGLVQDWLQLQDIIKDEEKAVKHHQKAKNTLEKKHQKFDKTPEKMKPGEIDSAATNVANAFDVLKLKQEEKVKATEEYEQKKTAVMTEALTNSIKIEGKFHQNAVNSLSDASELFETLNS